MASTAGGTEGPASQKPSEPSPAVLDLPEDVEFYLKQFDHLLKDLQKALEAAAAQVPTPADLAAIPEPLERARLGMCIAKAVNALHHVYCRAQGRDPFAPPTSGGTSVGRQELERIRQYDKKIARAVYDSSRPVLSLNVAAASRFIDAAIPDLTDKQREDLKRAAEAAQAKRGGSDGRRGKKPRQDVGPTVDVDTQQERTQQGHQQEQQQGEADYYGEEEQQRKQEAKGGAGAEGKGGVQEKHVSAAVDKKRKSIRGRGGGSLDAGAHGTTASAAAGPSSAQAAAAEFLAALAANGDF